jgi:ribosomal protein L18
MAPVSATEHYGRLRQSLNDLHGRIASAMRNASSNWTAARVQFQWLLPELDSLAAEHDAWAAAYLADLREVFGPGSELEQQQQQNAAGVRRWINQDRVYVLLGLAATEQLLGDWPRAEGSLARASELIDSLAAGGSGQELAAQQLMVLSQRASVLVQLALDREGDRPLAARALDCALRARDQAEASSSWFVAIETGMLAARCAKAAGDLAAFERYGQHALQVATQHQYEIGPTGDIPSLPRYAQSVLMSLQQGSDQSGQIARLARQGNKAIALDVVSQLRTAIQLSLSACGRQRAPRAPDRPGLGEGRWPHSGTPGRSCSEPCPR